MSKKLKKQKNRVIDSFKQIQAVQHRFKLPFDFWRLACESAKEIEIMGNQITMGQDYLTLEEARGAFDEVVAELGGTITWEK